MAKKRYPVRRARRLHPRDARPEAEVLAEAEGDVRVRPTPDVEAIGICEDRGVPIRGGIEHRDRVACRKIHAAKFEVANGRASEVVNG